MNWIGPSLATVGVAVFFLVLRVLSRSQAASVAARGDRAALEARWERFSRIESLIGLVIVLGVGGGGTVFLAQGLHSLAESYHAEREGFLHHLSFRWYYWAFVAAPFVFLILVCGSIVVYKMILRDSFDEYRAFGILRYGFDTLRVALWMSAVLFPVGVAGFLLGMDAYAGATESEVVVNDYFSFEERRYGFDRVRAIRERVKARKSTWDRSYVIEFDDGTRWKSEVIEGAADAPVPPLLEYVAGRSGIAIEREELPAGRTSRRTYCAIEKRTKAP